MKLYGVTETQLKQCLAQANKKYDGNLTFKYTTQKRNHVEFTMGVNGSRGKGGRLNHTLSRHVAAACWHAHRDLMREIFEKYPTAKLVSCKAVYDGKSGFEANFERTGNQNIGSMMQWCCYRDACECGR